MSTNPNDAVGTNAAYGGRTSANAFNDNLSAYTTGILSGWACSPSSGLTVSLGGDGTTRDVAIAEDSAGNKTTINNISNSPISATLSAAPASNSRIDAIVAYVDNPPQGVTTTADNPGACGFIVVKGTAAASPVAPNAAAIRSAITADGASGSTAYYVVLALITITAGTTDIVAGDITPGASAALNMTHIPAGGITSDKIDFATLSFGNYSLSEQDTGFTWLDGKKIYKKSFQNTFSGSMNTIDVTSLNIDLIINWKNTAVTATSQTVFGYRTGADGNNDYLMMGEQYDTSGKNLQLYFGSNFQGSKTVYTTIWYTKSS